MFLASFSPQFTGIISESDAASLPVGTVLTLKGVTGMFNGKDLLTLPQPLQPLPVYSISQFHKTPFQRTITKFPNFLFQMPSNKF